MIKVNQKITTKKGIVLKGTYNKLPEALVSDVNLKIYVVGKLIDIGDTEIKYTEKQTTKYNKIGKNIVVEKKVTIIGPDGIQTPKGKEGKSTKNTV